jgi:hypothetical protein
MILTRRLDAGWDISFGQGIKNFCSGAEATAQKVKMRLQVVLGEWFLDTSAGIFNPDTMSEKPLNLPYLESVAKACIIKTDGVASLIRFVMSWDSISRELVINVSLNTVYGTIENIQVRRA